MQLFEKLAEYGIPEIHISEAEWRERYANTYNVLALNGPETDKLLAAQDIIMIYLLLQAEREQERRP